MYANFRDFSAEISPILSLTRAAGPVIVKTDTEVSVDINGTDSCKFEFDAPPDGSSGSYNEPIPITDDCTLYVQTTTDGFAGTPVSQEYLVTLTTPAPPLVTP